MPFWSGSKVVPKNIILDPIILSVWFMDDGSKYRKKDVYFNTQQFDLINQKRLIEALSNINILANLNKDKGYKRIRMFSDSINVLNSLIEGYAVPSTRYKLSYNPVETTRRSPSN